jgi:hypothetical protein
VCGHPLCLLLDYCAVGQAQCAKKEGVPAAAHPPPPIPSTQASCSADLVANGLVPAEHILVPNPDASVRRELLATLPSLQVMAGTSGDALERLAQQLAAAPSHPPLAACWLDYCSTIDSDSNRRDLRLLFEGGAGGGGGGLLRGGACLCFTYSWRGGSGADGGVGRRTRRGRHKDGQEFLASYGEPFLREHWVVVPEALRARRVNNVALRARRVNRPMARRGAAGGGGARRRAVTNLAAPQAVRPALFLYRPRVTVLLIITELSGLAGNYLRCCDAGTDT